MLWCEGCLTARDISLSWASPGYGFWHAFRTRNRTIGYDLYESYLFSVIYFFYFYSQPLQMFCGCFFVSIYLSIIYLYAITKTMCPLSYHHNGFVATHALGHIKVHDVPKCKCIYLYMKVKKQHFKNILAQCLLRLFVLSSLYNFLYIVQYKIQ